MYKECSRLKLRFTTTKGPLSVEHLWDLTLNALDKMAIAYQEAYEKSGGKSFLVQKSQKDKELKLRFDIVRDILDTKVQERDLKAAASGIKARNEKIMEVIQRKQDSELEGKSLDELNKMLE